MAEMTPGANGRGGTNVNDKSARDSFNEARRMPDSAPEAEKPSTVGGIGSAVTGAANAVGQITSSLKDVFGPNNNPPGGGYTGGGGGGGYTGGGGGGGGSSAPTAKKYDINTNLGMPTQKTQAQIAKERAALSAALNPEAEEASIDRVNYYDKQPMVDLMTQEIDAARQQYNNQIDNAMNTEARDLNRALIDAQAMYQTQQNAITANELNALDNAALYAEARGDKGGIGQAQYNSIQNTAAQNRQAVQSAQTKLATDTARQISDLRAQGEFERADRMLETTQRYLSELRQIEEYAANYNLSVDQVNTAIAEWEYNFNQAAQQFATNTELSLAQMTGRFSNGTQTYAAAKDSTSATAQMALNLLNAGVEPTRLSKTQLAALQSEYGLSQKGINALFKKITGR